MTIEWEPSRKCKTEPSSRFNPNPVSAESSSSLDLNPDVVHRDLSVEPNHQTAEANLLRLETQGGLSNLLV